MALLNIYPGVAQFGSALGSGPRGRGFESRHSDQKKETAKWRLFFIFDFVWLVQKSFCAMPIDVQNHDGWRDLSEI